MYVDSIVEIKHFINTFSLMWKKLKKTNDFISLKQLQVGRKKFDDISDILCGDFVFYSDRL